MRVIRKVLTQIDLTSGTDRVIALMPIAPGGTFHRCTGEVHVILEDFSKIKAIIVPSRLYAVQMVEIDDLSSNWDTLWDRFIPKDDDVSEVAATFQVDLDRDTPETRPFEEYGEPNINELFGITEPTTLLFRRDALITIASSPVGYEGAAVDTYVATERYSVNVRRDISFPNGGFVAMGVASPDFDDVTQSVPVGMAGATLTLMYQNLDDFLHVARLAMLGLTETGSETPFVNMLTLIEDLTEPTILEDAAGAFVNVGSRIFARFIFDVSTPTSQETKVLQSG